MKPKVLVLVESCPACHDRRAACDACDGSGTGLRCARCRVVRGSAEVELVGDELVCAPCAKPEGR